MRIFTPLVMLITLGVAGAAEQPDAKALLLDASKGLFKPGATVRMEQQTAVEMNGAGMNNKMNMVLKMTAADGKFRMEVTPIGVTVVSDGQNMWFWMGPLNQYMKRPSAGSPEGIAESFMGGAGSMMKNAMDAMTARITRQDVVEVQGKKIECYVVEAALDKLEMPAPATMTIRNTRQTVWIDKDRRLPMKQIADMEMQMSGAASPIQMHQEMTLSSIDFAPVLKADEFVFTPPAGAKLVDSLPGMPAAAR